jgi:hypothetical protein
MYICIRNVHARNEVSLFERIRSLPSLLSNRLTIVPTYVCLAKVRHFFSHLERGQGHVEPDAGPQVDDGLGADGGAAVRDLGLLHLAERSLHKNNIFLRQSIL